MIKAQDIAYSIYFNNVDIDEVITEYTKLQLVIPDETHEYEYKGKANIKISTSLSVELPFALKVVVDEPSKGMDILYKNLNVRYKKMYSMIDMTVKVTTVNKIK